MSPPETRAPDGYFHPASEEAVAALVHYARSRGLCVRVRGSAHSEAAAIASDAFAAGRPSDSVEIMLDRLNGIRIDRDARRVTVGGGCKFGFDPGDITGRSTADNGLCVHLDAAGLALPTLGGVTHQTVAGFLATGSDGGSLDYSLHEQVVAFRLVDGLGEVRRFSREDADFWGALVNLGCLGVVTSVTLRCVPRFDVVGEERVVRRGSAPFDLFGSGAEGIEGYLRRHDYARVLWWPQPGVDKLVLWQGDQTRDGVSARPYDAFPRVAGSRLPMQAAAGLALRAIGRRPEASPERFRPVSDRLLARIYDAFVPEDPPQRFAGSWHTIVPLDDQMEERLMPVRFIELWVGFDDAPEFLSRLANLHRRRGYAATGNFVVELYGGKTSEAWMAPSHARDCLRLNFFWLTTNPGDPATDFFPQFWGLCRGLDVRQHWGKVLDPQAQSMLPRQEQWLGLRERCDPEGLFLTSYWKKHLGLRDGAEPPMDSMMPGRFQKPFFTLEPSDVDFIEEARGGFTVGFETRASPEATYDLLGNTRDPRAWIGGLMHDYCKLTGPGNEVGTVADEHFVGITVRVRTVVADRGRRWASSVDACNLPLARRMLQDIQLSPRGEGTQVRWTVYYDALPQVAPLEPLIRPLFRGFFAQLATRAARHLDRAAA